MIRRLRLKFIALSMFSLLAVLLVIVGSINLLNYRQVVSDADLVLDLLLENGGSFPAPHERPFRPEGLSPELPYESRYFSVTLDGSGAVLAADTGQIAAVDGQTAAAYARLALSRGNSPAFLGDYRYAVRQGAETLVVFLDCGRSLSTFRAFLFTSLWISLAGLGAVLLLLVVLSRRIVRPVQESYEKQKRFITDAGHEIKTPLTIIDADAELLEMEVGENEWLQDIQKQTRRLAGLTHDLIYLSRMEEAQDQIPMIEFPLSDLVAETAQSFQAMALSQGKTFTSAVEPMLSLQGEEKSLRQLVSILLDNALKYSDPGGRISLTLEKQGRAVRLAVFNTAPAVSQEDLERLFDRFYRGDSSRSAQGGYGIGLSIASAVVAAHRGKIAASSQDGKSLLITVLLPQQQKKNGELF